ncbi:signal transduction histidine kinase [Litorivivens lipolytica]|uniref:histidine kinase n=1 Tax=Litorivivens lipolytica TaxID=1524264 RepID=A0A7W4W3B6_9GAMM|nr:ATP-binding protein [Litorivivens lipolytica]MBB3046688.1 signal transduction histidine kinase [Litorivivens lipolytica]
MNDVLKLRPENDSPADVFEETPWQILVVDDDEEVHRITELALSEFVYANRRLEFINAYSAIEAREKLLANPGVALILLDVVMETDDAGLRFAQFVRQDIGNSFIRIILRTGQPGLAPERHVLTVYDINDYRAKTELTQDRLYTVVYTALSSYRDMMALARSRQQLVGVVEELETLSEVTSRSFRQALKTLVADTQVIYYELEKDISPTQHRQLQDVLELSRELFRKVDDLARYSESGRYNELRVPVDLSTLVDDVRLDLRESIEEMQAEFDCDDLPVVMGSRRQLYQVFYNLISNALRFRSEQPPRIGIEAKKDMDVWRFAVSDNGIGISDADRQNAFSLFRRENSRDVPASSGVGLNICRKIVRWHGGTIDLKGDPGEGTRVEFTLPLIS